MHACVLSWKAPPRASAIRPGRQGSPAARLLTAPRSRGAEVSVAEQQAQGARAAAEGDAQVARAAVAARAAAAVAGVAEFLGLFHALQVQECHGVSFLSGGTR